MSDASNRTMLIEGQVAPRFAKVREAFAENFASRGEVGACVAVYLDGEPVVDIWGGQVVRDQKPDGPWQRDTLAPMMSVNKGVIAICAHRLVDQGKLDYARPVAEYWPEFAQAGKENITVRMLLSGMAALVYPEKVRAGGIVDWQAMVVGLAAQEPAWVPGTRGAYHSSTYGHLVGELIRRITGKMPSVYFKEEIGDPLGLDYWFAVPESERQRVSGILPNPNSDTARAIAGTGAAKLGRAWRVMPRPDLAGVVSDPELLGIEMPSFAGKGHARGIGKLFAALALGGTLEGVTVLKPERIAAAVTEQWRGFCALLDRDFRYGMGLMLNHSPLVAFGPSSRSFGHPGAGGAVGFADPDQRLSFSYATSFMCAGAGMGDRGPALIDALYASLH